MHNTKCNVLIVDYRGYGKSEGIPTEEGMYEDVRAAMNWLKSWGVPTQQIINYGFSLGSAPATDLMAFGMDGDYPNKLILESETCIVLFILLTFNDISCIVLFNKLILESETCIVLFILLTKLVNPSCGYTEQTMIMWLLQMARPS